jgi:hypothetical protein
MKHERLIIPLYWRLEELVVSWIATFWRPKRIGGSSKAKADLILRSYFRIFLLSLTQWLVMMTGKITFFNS